MCWFAVAASPSGLSRRQVGFQCKPASWRSSRPRRERRGAPRMRSSRMRTARRGGDGDQIFLGTPRGGTPRGGTPRGGRQEGDAKRRDHKATPKLGGALSMSRSLLETRSGGRAARGDVRPDPAPLGDGGGPWFLGLLPAVLQGSLLRQMRNDVERARMALRWSAFDIKPSCRNVGAMRRRLL
jgi:hypothetical protein